MQNHLNHTQPQPEQAQGSPGAPRRGGEPSTSSSRARSSLSDALQHHFKRWRAWTLPTTSLPAAPQQCLLHLSPKYFDLSSSLKPMHNQFRCPLIRGAWHNLRAWNKSSFYTSTAKSHCPKGRWELGPLHDASIGSATDPGLAGPSCLKPGPKVPKRHGFSSADHLLEPVLRFPSPPTPPGPTHGAAKVQPRGAQPGGSGTPKICGEGRGAQREGRKAAEGVEKSPDREQREGSAA